jgi:hypothetical protein
MDELCKNCGESMWLHPEFDYHGYGFIKCKIYVPERIKMTRIPEGTYCRLVKKSDSLESDLIDYHLQYRKGLKIGERLMIYEDYGYTSHDHVGWYFAISDSDVKYLIHSKEIQVEIEARNETVLEWLDSMTLQV